MIETIIPYTIISIAVSIALAFLTKSTEKSIDKDESGNFNLKMNKLYGIIGIISVLFGLLFLIFIPLTVGVNESEIWIVVILILLISFGLGIPCLMYYRNHRVIFNSNSIIVSNVFGKVKEIKWSDIIDVRYKAFSGLLILTTKIEQIKVHQHLVGLSNFVEFIEKKTKCTIKELKIPIRKK